MPMPVFHEEAKLGETLCPFSFAVPDVRGPDGSGITQGGPWPCAGRRCMGWRFARTHVWDADGMSKESDDTHGYCGLAGVPGQVRP